MRSYLDYPNPNRDAQPEQEHAIEQRKLEKGAGRKRGRPSNAALAERADGAEGGGAEGGEAGRKRRKRVVPPVPPLSCYPPLVSRHTTPWLHAALAPSPAPHTPLTSPSLPPHCAARCKPS